jgi:hypothetical protein
MPSQDIIHRFAYHPPPDEHVANLHSHIRAIMSGAAAEVEANVPPGREQSLAITKLEEAMMWANAGIARANGATQLPQ